MTSELPTSLWLEACLRDFSNKGGFYTYIHKGPANGGAVLLKVYVSGQGAQLYSQYRDMDGKLAWMEIFEGKWVDERQADAYIKRQIENDPDLWVVEMESREKENPLKDLI